MTFVEAGILASVGAILHTGGILWYADKTGYHLLPSDRDSVSSEILAWVYLGLIIKAAVPVVLFVVFGLISPLILFLLGLVLILVDEAQGSAGDSLGVIYLGLWPIYVGVFILVGVVEAIVF